MKYALIIITLLLIAGCDFFKKSDDLPLPELSEKAKEKIIATVNGEPVLLHTLKQEMKRRGGHLPGRFASDQAKEKLLDEVIYFELMSQEAKRLGYHKDPDVQLAIKKLLVQKFKNDHINSHLKKMTVTDEEVEEEYKKNLEDYKTAEMVRTAVIQFRYNDADTKKIRADRKKQAEKVRYQAHVETAKSPTFGNLAQKYSDHTRTKYKGGAMNWISKGNNFYQWNVKVIDAMFQLKKKGEVSPVIEASDGLYILKLMGREEPKTRSLAAVRSRIEAELKVRKKQQWLKNYYQKLKEGVDISINEEALSKLDLKRKKGSQGAEPPGFPVK